MRRSTKVDSISQGISIPLDDSGSQDISFDDYSQSNHVNNRSVDYPKAGHKSMQIQKNEWSEESRNTVLSMDTFIDEFTNAMNQSQRTESCRDTVAVDDIDDFENIEVPQEGKQMSKKRTRAKKPTKAVITKNDRQ